MGRRPRGGRTGSARGSATRSLLPEDTPQRPWRNHHCRCPRKNRPRPQHPPHGLVFEHQRRCFLGRGSQGCRFLTPHHHWLYCPSIPFFRSALGDFGPSHTEKSTWPKAGPTMVSFSLPLMARLEPVPGTYVKIIWSPALIGSRASSK